MAGSQSCLKSQLLEKLNNKSDQLSKRFDVAVSVFTSEDIPLLHKEEIIFDWFRTESSGAGDIGVDFFVKLNECLRSDQLRLSRCEISYCVLKGIINVFSGLSSISNGAVQEAGRCCLISLLETPMFHEVFCREVDLLCDAIKWYASCDLVPPNRDEIETIARMYLLMSRVSLMSHDMNISFIKEVLAILCKALRHAPDNSSGTHAELCSAPIENCIHQIISKDSSFVEHFLEQFPTKKFEEETYVSCFIHLMKTLPKQHNVEVVDSCYLHFLSSVIKINKNNHNKTFKVFMSLCKCLGINVKGMISIEMKPKKNWTHEESFRVIGQMVDLMSREKVSIHCGEDEENMTVWFTSMLIGLTGIIGANLTAEYLDMLASVLRFDPLIVDSAHTPIFNIILTRKPHHKLKLSYIQFLQSCIDGAFQTSRFQKFITKFFSMAEESLKFTVDTSLSVEDILPGEVKETFCSVVSKLPGTQVIAIARCFVYNMQTIGLKRLEQGGGSDIDLIIYMEVITRALSYFLKGVKVTDYTTPAIIKEKFHSILLEIEQTLRSFMEMLLETKSMFADEGHRLVVGVLNACQGVGWCRLLELEYEAPPRPLDDLDFPPVNLTIVHPYLPPEKWEQLAILVDSSPHRSVKDSFHELVMQKVRGVSGLEEGEEGPGVAAAIYLLGEASPAWHWAHAVDLAPLLQDNELLGLLDILVRAAGLNAAPWSRLLSTPHIVSNKRIVVGASVALLNAIASYMNKNVGDGALIFRIMTHVPVVSLLEYELSRLVEDSIELKETLSRCLSGMGKQLKYLRHRDCPSPCNEDLPLHEFMELLMGLPYEECSEALQVCMIGALLGMLNDLPRGSSNDHLILMKLSRMLDECKMVTFGSKLIGRACRVMQFLVTRADGWSGQRLLFSRWCRFALRSGCDASRLVMAVEEEPTVETLWQYTTLIRLLHPLVKDDGEEREIEHWMGDLVKRSVCLLMKRAPCVETLADYPVVLREASLPPANPPQGLLDHLPAYLQLAETNYSEGEYLIKFALKHLQDSVPQNFFEDLWKKSISVQEKPNQKIVELFLKIASVEILKIVVDDIHDSLEQYVASKDPLSSQLPRALVVWSELVSLEVYDRAKEHIRGEALSKLMAPLLSVSMDCQPDVLAILSFLSHLVEATHVRLTEEVMDACLVIVERTPLTREEHLPCGDAGLTVLLALVWFRKNLMEDRVPALLAVLRSYARRLAALATPSLQDNSSILLLEAALLKFNKGIQLLMKNKKQFPRIAPYLISDILQLLGTHQIHHKAKSLLVEAVKSLLSVCDEHGVAFLSSSLDPACKELFKVYHQQYNASYKYRGKI